MNKGGVTDVAPPNLNGGVKFNDFFRRNEKLSQGRL